MGAVRDNLECSQGINLFLGRGGKTGILGIKVFLGRLGNVGVMTVVLLSVDLAR